VALQAGDRWKNCAAHDISEEFCDKFNSGFRMREAEAHPAGVYEGESVMQGY
jgi:hypothetical protein